MGGAFRAGVQRLWRDTRLLHRNHRESQQRLKKMRKTSTRAAFHGLAVAQQLGGFHVLAADGGPAIVTCLVTHRTALNNPPFSPHALIALTQAVTHLARSDGVLTERLRIADQWLTRVRPADMEAELWADLVKVRGIIARGGNTSQRRQAADN